LDPVFRSSGSLIEYIVYIRIPIDIKSPKDSASRITSSEISDLTYLSRVASRCQSRLALGLSLLQKIYNHARSVKREKTNIELEIRRRARSSPRWTGKVPLFTKHVSRVLACVRITSQTTVSVAPALGASRASSRLLGQTDTDRCHHSRVPRVMPEHCGAYAVKRSRGFL
jgi:hypothetical protein